MNKISIKMYSLKIDADLAKLLFDTLGIKSEVLVKDSIISGALGNNELVVDSGQSQRALSFIEIYEKDIKKSTDSQSIDKSED